MERLKIENLRDIIKDHLEQTTKYLSELFSIKHDIENITVPAEVMESGRGCGILNYDKKNIHL